MLERLSTSSDSPGMSKSEQDSYNACFVVAAEAPSDHPTNISACSRRSTHGRCTKHQSVND